MEKYYISSTKFSITERKTKLHGKVYDISFRIITMDGVVKQKKVSGFETKALAKQWYVDFIQQHCTLVRNNPLKKKSADKEKLLVGDLVRQYMATLGNQNKQSVIYDKENIFRNYILCRYESTPIDALTKEELYAWQDDLWQKKNPKTGEYFSYPYLTKIRGIFSTFLSWVEQRYSFKNRLLEVNKPRRRQAKKETSIWTREQFEKFISLVDDATYKTLFTFMFFTGRRKGELFALYKTDVKPTEITFDKSVNRRKLGKETWEITSTKANKSCTIPVCKVVQDAIKAYVPPKEGNFYFGGKEPLALSTVSRKFDYYTNLAGLPHIRIHDLRHSFVSMLISLGADFTVVSDLISDTVEQVVRTYAHLYKGARESVLAKII